VLVVESAPVLTAPEAAVFEDWKKVGGRMVWTNTQTWFVDYQRAARLATITVEGPETSRGCPPALLYIDSRLNCWQSRASCLTTIKPAQETPTT
jgi:hypothetical protein